MDFTYCPKCKSELQKKDRLFVCPSCDLHIYENPAPSNAVIIENEQGEILLVKRKYNPSQNLWDLPGGFIDVKESVEESIQREMKEELNIEVYDCKYIGSYPDTYLFKGMNLPTLGLVFSAKTSSKQMKAQDDASEVKYFPKEKIPYQDLAFPTIKKALSKYFGQ